MRPAKSKATAIRIAGVMFSVTVKARFAVRDSSKPVKSIKETPLRRKADVERFNFLVKITFLVVLAVEGWWLLNVVGAIVLFALGATLMLADAKLGTGLVSLMGAACTFIAILVLIPVEAPPENWEFVTTVRNVMLACSIVATGFFLFVSYKAYEAKRLRKRLDTSNLIGMKGVVKADLDPRGVVNVGGELWSAVAERGEYIAVGEEVEVVGYEGITLIVRRLGGEDEPVKWYPTEA